MNGTWLTLGTVGIAAALSELKRGSSSRSYGEGGWSDTFYEIQRAQDEGGDWVKMEKEAINKRLGQKPKSRYPKWFNGADTWKLGNLDGEEWLLVDKEDGSYQAVFVTNRGKNFWDLNLVMNFGLGPSGMVQRRSSNYVYMAGPGSDRSERDGASASRGQDIASERLAYPSLMQWMDWYLPVGNSRQTRAYAKTGSRDWGGSPKGFGAPMGRSPYIRSRREANQLVKELNARDWEAGYAYEVVEDDEGIFVRPIDLTLEQVLTLGATPDTSVLKMGSKNATEKRWTDYAKKHLLNRKITAVRYLTKDEAKGLGWYQRSLLLQLDNGTIIFMSKDDEGNDGGALFGQSEDGELTFPVIR